MNKVLFFAGSNSSKSINHQLVSFAATQLSTHQAEIIKLTDYKLPLFSEDLERNDGYSEALKNLNNKIQEFNAIVISVNEHNRTVSAYFKNVLDWLSRLDREFLNNKKILLLSTSNGKRGASAALKYTTTVLPRFGAEVIDSFSLPSFSKNFSMQEQAIVDNEQLTEFRKVLKHFEDQLSD